MLAVPQQMIEKPVERVLKEVSVRFTSRALQRVVEILDCFWGFFFIKNPRSARPDIKFSGLLKDVPVDLTVTVNIQYISCYLLQSYELYISFFLLSQDFSNTLLSDFGKSSRNADTAVIALTSKRIKNSKEEGLFSEELKGSLVIPTLFALGQPTALLIIKPHKGDNI